MYQPPSTPAIPTPESDPVESRYGRYTQTGGETKLNGGNILSKTSLDIQAGAVTGSGVAAGGVSNGGQVSPGFSAGAKEDIIDIRGNYTQSSTGTLQIEIGGLNPGGETQPPEFDQVGVIGAVTLDGTLNVNLLLAYVPAFGDQFVIVNNDATDAIVGTFDGLLEGATFTVGTSQFRISYLGVDGNGNDVVLTATNLPPTAEAGGPYTVAEGGSIQLDASGSSDPEQPASTLTYEWDLDGDGLFGETGTSAERGDETGVNPTFSATGLDGPSSVTVSLRVTDNGGLSDIDTATIDIVNVAPEITGLNSSNAAPCNASPDGVVTIDGSFSDPAGALDTHTVTVDWGDQTGAETLTSVDQTGDLFDGTHTYADGGIYTITVTVEDDDGGVSEAFSTTATITGVGVVDGTLYVIGTHGKDHVDVKLLEPGGSDGGSDGGVDEPTIRVQARLNTGGSDGGSDAGSDAGSDGGADFTVPAASVQNIVMYLCDGDDHALIHKNVTVPALVYGGAGKDHLKAGGGDATLLGGPGHDHLDGGDANDMLVGGEGNDKLKGGKGDDVLIGGIGKDDLNGGAGDDLLIGGSTAYDNFVAALDAIHAEWGSGASFEDRVAHLQAGVGSNGDVKLEVDTTVFGDGEKDKLKGDKGQDWILADDEDKVTDEGGSDGGSDGRDDDG